MRRERLLFISALVGLLIGFGGAALGIPRVLGALAAAVVIATAYFAGRHRS
jgi:hypothetical protein